MQTSVCHAKLCPRVNDARSATARKNRSQLKDVALYNRVTRTSSISLVPVVPRRTVVNSTRSVQSRNRQRLRTNSSTGSVEEGDVDVVSETFSSKLVGKRALVAGATGGVGRKLVEQLRALGVPVVALVRDKSKADGVLLDEGVQIVEGDVYQYQTLPKAVQDCNVVLCATGCRPSVDPLGPFNVDYQGTKNLIVAAQRADVEHFVFVTSIGTDDILFPLNLFWGVLFWKKRAEEELQRSGLKYTIVRPGGLKDEPTQASKPGNVVMKGANEFGLPPKQRPGSILRKQVAEVCINALVEPAAANKIVEIIAEDEAPYASYGALFSRVLE